MPASKLVRRGLGSLWGVTLYVWLHAGWATLMIIGLSQVVWAVLAAAGLPVTSDLVTGPGWGFAALFVAVLSWVALWGSHHVAWIPRARRLTEDNNACLYRAACEQAKLAGLPLPEIVESQLFTASAVGRSLRHATLGVSPELQRKLDPQEVRAVLSHELAHLSNRDALLMTVAMTIVGFVLAITLLSGFHGWIGATVLLLSCLSWIRECKADTTAAYASGDPSALATALRKLPRSGFLSFLLSPYTHPPTALRVWKLKRLTERVTH